MERRNKCRVLLTIVLFMMCQMVCGQTFVDRSNMTLGKVKSDGYVVDRNNMTIGRAKDVPTSYAAVFFFFHLFQ